MYKQYDTKQDSALPQDVKFSLQLASVNLLKRCYFFHTKLKDCLEIKFPNFDEDITIHQLLTHSAGIPDYFDESIMDNFERLGNKHLCIY